MRVYYFGCKEEKGHFLWQPNRITTIRPQESGLPWKHIDAALCPQITAQQGVSKIHHKDGWTAMAFWDKSIDGRPGSNSVFFYEDLLDFDQMLSEFKEHFHWVVNRFKFPLVEMEYPSEDD